MELWPSVRPFTNRPSTSSRPLRCTCRCLGNTCRQISPRRYRRFQRSVLPCPFIFPEWWCRYTSPGLSPNTSVFVLGRLTKTIERTASTKIATLAQPSLFHCTHGARRTLVLAQDLLDCDGASPHECLREERVFVVFFSGATFRSRVVYRLCNRLSCRLWLCCRLFRQTGAAGFLQVFLRAV